MTTTDYMKARRLLARRDPIIGALMKRHGKCGLADAQHEDAFVALVHAIVVVPPALMGLVAMWWLGVRPHAPRVGPVRSGAVERAR